MGMSTAEADVRGRGRPRQFDENEVLDSIIELFWDRGFENASLSDIVEAAGLNKSSLYNTFGSKDELFFAAIDRYMNYRKTMLDESLSGDGFDLIEMFLEFMRIETASDGGCRGCLAINACTELGLRDPRAQQLADKYRAMFRDRLRPALRTAADRGELDPAMIDVYADVMVGFAISVAVAARSGSSTEELHRQIDSLQQLVNAWRLS
jgi:TetR/AcrR family transcriptional repressor of nem operon